jgi:hypothetical protein
MMEDGHFRGINYRVVEEMELVARVVADIFGADPRDDQPGEGVTVEDEHPGVRPLDSAAAAARDPPYEFAHRSSAHDPHFWTDLLNVAHSGEWRPFDRHAPAPAAGPQRAALQFAADLLQSSIIVQFGIEHHDPYPALRSETWGGAAQQSRAEPSRGETRRSEPIHAIQPRRESERQRGEARRGERLHAAGACACACARAPVCGLLSVRTGSSAGWNGAEVAGGTASSNMNIVHNEAGSVNRGARPARSHSARRASSGPPATGHGNRIGRGRKSGSSPPG